MPLVRVAQYCRCGAAWSGRVATGKAEALAAVFWQAHQGDGHGFATARQAREARRNAETAEALAAYRASKGLD